MYIIYIYIYIYIFKLYFEKLYTLYKLYVRFTVNKIFFFWKRYIYNICHIFQTLTIINQTYKKDMTCT